MRRLAGSEAVRGSNWLRVSAKPHKKQTLLRNLELKRDRTSNVHVVYPVQSRPHSQKTIPSHHLEIPSIQPVTSQPISRLQLPMTTREAPPTLPARFPYVDGDLAGNTSIPPFLGWRRARKPFRM